jgi:hypothetical protein
VLIPLAVVIVIFGVEFALCNARRLPPTIDAKNLETVKAAEAALGPPLRQIVAPARDIANREFLGVQMPSTFSAPPNQPLRVTGWERRCLLFGYQRLILVSSTDDRTLFVGGVAKNFFPSVVVRGVQAQ